MRAAHLAFLIALGIAQDATAQTSTPSGSTQPSGTQASSQGSGSASIAGQSMTSGPNASIATQIMPAPLVTTPPINPAPGTTQTLNNVAAQRTSRLRRHSLMGTSNGFQNGVNGSVESNGVINGTATMAPPPLVAPTTTMSSQNSSSATNGQATTATPAASTH